MKPNTMGSVMDSIRNAKTKEECLAAYEAYKAQCPGVAEENIRFGISYYCEGSEQARLIEWIFGVRIAYEPSKADLREIIANQDAEIQKLRAAISNTDENQ